MPKRLDRAPMEWKILQPSKKTINLTGKMFYREAIQAWNTLRIRKEILDEFPALKEKRSAFSYQMIFYRDYADLEKAIRKMKKDKLPTPLLLFFRKGLIRNQI